MYSATISNRRSIHSAPYPHIFIEDNKDGTASRLFVDGSNNTQRPDGRHFSLIDGCWMTRYLVSRLSNGIYIAESRASSKHVRVSVTVKDGSVEGLR